MLRTGYMVPPMTRPSGYQVLSSNQFQVSENPYLVRKEVTL